LYYLDEHKELQLTIGAEVAEMVNGFLGEENEQVTELKGMPAQKGKVIGTVWILKTNDPDAAQRFRKNFDNEILVTGMTQPNVVDIARKAKAIVTDEGGMLCHAAIISREFGTPCVVGTKNATKVLRDGDVVEVDANEGVVRIIEKAV
jgi:pyruvate,water dikinase